MASEVKLTAEISQETARELLAALADLYAACELRANREGGDFGDDIGPAAERAEAAITKATSSAGSHGE